MATFHELLMEVRLLLAANLRRVRREQGISQRELGRRAEVHSAQISRYERGLAVPKVVTLMQLARALHVPLADLLAPPKNTQESAFGK